MKKVLIVFTLMLTRGVDAFSDTTSIDSAYSSSFDDDWDSDDPVEKGVGKMLESMFSDTKLFSGMVIAIVAIVIIFLLAPLLIIIAIFYFVNKNRKEKMKLAQMAMEKGQPIPDELLNNVPDEVSDEYQKGMRQCFVGVGLMIFLYFAAGTIGFGIGALVFCIGLGKVLAAKSVGKRTPNNNNDDLTQQDYD